MSLLARVQIVLVRPAEPMNLGAAARAMKNCELSRLTLVDPRTDDYLTARRVAVHAEELLGAPRAVRSLAEAVADSVWVVGTTSRALPGRTPLTPREVAQEALRLASSGEVSLVFGGEESGLSNLDLVQCHAISTIPSGAKQPSFNLGQAVMLYAYEVFQAARAAAPRGALEPERATDRDYRDLEASLRRAMEKRGFTDPDRPGHGARELALTLRKAGLTPAEARLWRAFLAKVG